MLSEGSHYFSEDYPAARARFLEAGESAGAKLCELPLDRRAPDGTPLAINIAWLGSSDPERIVVHSSGLHGIEGFAGSAIQVAILEQAFSIPPDGAVLFVHALNPFGMAYVRRFNENNVDLNRNFHSAGEGWSGASAAYHRVNTFLNPPEPPRADFFYLRAGYLVLRYGLKPMKQAIAEGQYEFPKGLFFGGKQLERGPSLYLSWLASHLGSVTRGFAIDVHTGLGKWCQEYLFLRRSSDDDSELAKKLNRQLISDPSEKGVGYQIRGGYAGVFNVLDPQPQMYVVTQEFGTYRSLRVLHGLREENRWHHYGDGTVDHPAKLRLKEMFTPQSKEWRNLVVSRGVSFARDVMGYMFG